ncbi:hypothetical protein GQX73_g2262 [Xylaria multiplex]|uniref:Uncharacterized protein n=1 Tax=Xylaria multiplex TaxID=323545 RepID=A0A7C8MYJ3_9PEZI|nr:hypothetical protein GQX73_g2262 [Xylaria multiplex]
MSKENPQSCSALEISEWDATRGWQARKVDIHRILAENPSVNEITVSAGFANAKEVRTCEPCRGYFIDRFHMPKTWWSDYSRKSNGYFGCQHSHSPTTGQGSLETWVYFEIKQLDKTGEYHWYKVNIFIRWNKVTHQTVILAFDTPPATAKRLLEQLATPDPYTLQFPFWFYPHLLDEVAQHQEAGVWAIRDQVRAVEKEIAPKSRPNPDYRRLHDIARHAIHVTESLDVAVQTVQHILARHNGLIRMMSDKDGAHQIHSQLQFFESYISSLRCRSSSNEKRMSNEIQLAFNTVAQHDAKTSVKIALATQSDSLSMKSIALVTLAFLPPTFVCAIFSMSFFDYNADSGWAFSDKFWLYWVFAIPTTLLTAAAWYFLRKYSFSAPSKDEKRRFSDIMV